MDLRLMALWCGLGAIALLTLQFPSTELQSHEKNEGDLVHVKMAPSLNTAFQPLGKPNEGDIYGNEFVLRGNELVRIIFSDPGEQLSHTCRSNVRIWIERNRSPTIRGDMTRSSCWEMSADHPITPNGRCDFYHSIEDKVLMSMRYGVDACTGRDLEIMTHLGDLIEVK